MPETSSYVVETTFETIFLSVCPIGKHTEFNSASGCGIYKIACPQP